MSYASITDMTNRFDARLVGDLVSDTGTRVTNLTGNVILQAMLDGAAGEINAACFVGRRYTQADLLSLTGVDLALLIDINCVLAFARLRIRRGLPLEDHPEIQEVKALLQLLREGQRVFNLAAQENAGLPLDEFPSMQFFTSLNLLVDNCRQGLTGGYFSQRRVQSNAGQ